MEAAVPPWASDRCWNAWSSTSGAQASAAAFKVPPTSQPRILNKPKPSTDVNPWEGALGPQVAEASATAKTFKRADVSSLIKTAKEIWAKGKPSTQITTAPLPGANAERAAAKRTPSHLRGNEKASRGIIGFCERLPDYATIKATKRVWRVEEQKLPDGTSAGTTTTMTVRPKRCIPPRAQSAAAVLEGTEAEREGSTRRPETEPELEAFVRDLKAQFSRLQQTVKDKEAEFERLTAARDRSDKDEAQVGEADKDFEEFKARIDARHLHVEERLPDLVKQKHALEEVVKRLQKANKTMNNRLGQCREELRVYNGEIRDMNLLLREVETTRDEAQTQVDKLKASTKEDAKKRNEDLTRKQARVEKMLAETKEQAERLKEVEKRNKDREMARQAEEDLARQRAFENGTDFGTELRRIRENVHGPLAAENPLVPQEEEGKVATAVKKIFQAAQANEVDGVLAFWGKLQERKSVLENLSRDLMARVERLRSHAEDPAGTLPSDVGMDAAASEDGIGDADSSERQALESAVRDIETFADQNMAVNEAMRQLLQKYTSWMASVYTNMVRASEDDNFLRLSHKIARRIPRSGDDQTHLAMWCSDSLVTFQRGLESKMQEVEKAQRRGQPADAVPRGPGTGPRITALSSNQTLLVTRGGSKMSTEMEKI